MDKQSQKTILSDTQICCCSCCTTIVEEHFTIFNILFFQFSSMIFLTYCIIFYEGLLTFPGVFVTIMGMFVSLMWTGRFTGAYLNPALTIACMIKKQRKVPVIKAIVYLAVQFLGAIIGTFFAWALKGDLPAPFQAEYTINTVAQIFGKQVIGTFMYCLIIMIMISSDTTFLDLEIQIWLSTPLILITVCQMTRLPLGCNPAWGLAYQLVWGINNSQFYEMNYLWSVIVGPIIGGVLAGVFFEFLFRRFVSAYKSELKREHDLFMERLNAAQRIEEQLRHRITVLELV